MKRKNLSKTKSPKNNSGIEHPVLSADKTVSSQTTLSEELLQQFIQTASKRHLKLNSLLAQTFAHSSKQF